MNPELLMTRCLELASLGFPAVMPNPAVGCVIVHNDKIIGEGYHTRYGSAHAEVNAINSVLNKELLKEATLYVNLEPCNHYGKTPPCTELIIKEGIRKVVIAASDPNPTVKGGGAAALREAGIEVITGILENEAKDLNKRFYTFHAKYRPWILLKWAQTADKFIAGINGKTVSISNDYTRLLVHKWRTEEQAILVGTHTAMNDNPYLTARDWPGKNPLRVVIDRKLILPRSLHIFDNSTDTWVLNEIREDMTGKTRYLKLSFGNNLLDSLMAKLAENGVQSIMAEGGSITLQHFIGAGLWDEARVITSPKKLGSGIKAPSMDLNPESEQWIEGDRVQIFRNL